MWSDNDIDNAFQRLDPPDPEPAPFPLDAWLRLDAELDKAVIERAVRRRLWKFFAAEVAVVLLAALGWLLWPTGTTGLTTKASKPTVGADKKAANNKSSQQATATQSAIAEATNHPDAALRNTQSATNISGSSASTEAAVETPEQELAPYAATAPVAAAPIVKRSSSKATTRPSVAAAATPNRRRRNSAKARLAYQGVLVPQHAPRLNKRRNASTLPEHTSAEALLTEAAARRANGQTTTLVNNTDRHPAAGSIAAPTEAPAEAVVADAASPSQLRREGQSPLRNRIAALPATTASEGATSDESVAGASNSAMAVAALSPITSRLPAATLTDLPAPLAPTTVVPADLPIPVRQPRFYI